MYTQDPDLNNSPKKKLNHGIMMFLIIVMLQNLTKNDKQLSELLVILGNKIMEASLKCGVLLTQEIGMIINKLIQINLPRKIIYLRSITRKRMVKTGHNLENTLYQCPH